MTIRKLRMGMVGGGRGAFIGAVHRTAACLDHEVEFVAGALSSTPDKSHESGRDLGLAEDRNYGTWMEMLTAERTRPASDRIDFVSIVTPNDSHFAIARAFAAAGIHVVCDKPLVHAPQQADELVRLVAQTGVVFAVTYNYSGYPLVKQARELVRGGQIGAVRKIIVEYNQGWLATKLEATGQKQAGWRTDPARSGVAGALGDIGSHAEQLVSYVTGLEIESLCADLTTFVPGRRLDDDANMLLRFTGGARGILCASQVCVGNENDLRLRVWGETGGIEWHQEEPNALLVRRSSAPDQIFRRGNDYLADAAKRNTRLPSGHPEAFFEAFANVYRAASAAIRAGVGGLAAAEKFDFPGVIDGARGVHFIDRAVASAGSDAKWTDARLPRAASI